MAETRDDITDIAWLRDLAQEGTRAPMRGSAILMAAGLIYGTASLLHAVIAGDVLTVPEAAFNFLWLIATGLFLVVVTVVNLRMSHAGGVRTTASRGAEAVWTAVGWGIFALFTSLAVIGVRTGGTDINRLLDIVPSTIMVFYGLGWAVTGTLQKSRPLGWLAFASFLAAPLLALLAGTVALYIGYGAALYGLMALPGYLLMRAART